MPFKVLNKSTRLMQRVGFWVSREQPDLPDPHQFLDPGWDPAERDLVIAYLENSYLPSYVEFGPSWCRLGCPGTTADIGYQDRTDGTWVFPEGLVHYVRHHGLKPPIEFLEHVRRSNYVVPVLDEVAQDD
jgi:hypothetical protein